MRPYHVLPLSPLNLATVTAIVNPDKIETKLLIDKYVEYHIFTLVLMDIKRYLLVCLHLLIDSGFLVDNIFLVKCSPIQDYIKNKGINTTWELLVLIILLETRQLPKPVDSLSTLFQHTHTYIYILELILSRKSGKHLHAKH